MNPGCPYVGLVFGRLTVRVSLDRVALANPGDHAAVWAGVSTPDARDWVQAGVERTKGDGVGPFVYVELGRGGVQESIENWPWTLGSPVTVGLRRRGGLWVVFKF